MRTNLKTVVAAILLGIVVAAVGAPSAGAQILSRGDVGPAVATWQGNLNDWFRVNRPERGILAVDGIYGPRTEAATIGFQRAQDIRVDGVVGPQTRGAFEATAVADSPAEPGSRPLLVRGSRGDAVERWQQRLADNGAGIAVDGIYGPNTAAATRSFQSNQGILVDGIVGPQTRAAMRSVEAR
jgi:peptidoglycan hydrolase-like protein with peptidoglycan-binding domain